MLRLSLQRLSGVPSDFEMLCSRRVTRFSMARFGATWGVDVGGGS